MEKQKLGHQQKYVTKNERVENLWKKLIKQETHPTVDRVHAIRMCADSLQKTK